MNPPIPPKKTLSHDPRRLLLRTPLTILSSSSSLAVNVTTSDPGQPTRHTHQLQALPTLPFLQVISLVHKDTFLILSFDNAKNLHQFDYISRFDGFSERNRLKRIFVCDLLKQIRRRDKKWTLYNNVKLTNWNAKNIVLLLKKLMTSMDICIPSSKRERLSYLL